MIQEATKSDLWPAIALGLTKALSVETSDISLEDVSDLVEKNLLLIMVAIGDDEVIYGVAVLESQEDWIDVPVIWSTSLESLNSLLESTELLSVVLGKKGVKWATSNDSIAAYARRRGYRQRLVEYVKEN